MEVTSAPLPDTHSLYTLVNGRIVFEDRVLDDAALLVRDGKIAACGPVSNVPPQGEIFDLRGRILTPGLIDTHLHGALGRDFMEGGLDAVDDICRTHARRGQPPRCLPRLSRTRFLKSRGCFICSRKHGRNKVLMAHVSSARMSKGPFFRPNGPACMT